MEPTPTRIERRAPWRKGPRVGLGAMVGAIVLVAAACGGDDGPAAPQDATSATTSVATTTTVSSTTTTVAAVSSEDALAVVLSAIEARNRGDIAAYRASLTGDEAHVEAHNLSEALSYANATTELSGCRVTPNTPRGFVVECESTSTDDFYSAGGIVESGTTTFLVTENGKISNIDCCGGPNEDVPWEETETAMFNFSFWSWMMDAHPTVFDDVGPNLNPYDTPGLALFIGDSRDPAEMLIAAEYVAEFVAQSNVYPINP